MTTPTTPEQPEPSASARFKQGRVLRCRSDRHGTHDLLCVKSPGMSHEDRLRFMEVKPNGETRELLFWSSVKRDSVEKEWDNLADYYAAELASTRAASASPSAEQLWQTLKDECCSNPATAYRIVLLNEEQFMRAFKRAALSRATTQAGGAT